MKLIKKMSWLLIFGIVLTGCGGSSPSQDEAAKAPEPVTEVAQIPAALPVIDPKDDIGIGPITSMDLVEIDPALAEAGELIFTEKCAPCHKFHKRYTGPALAKVTERRRPEWIMNMMLNPDAMVKENAAAKQLLIEYLAPMANQGLSEEDARSILDYFRTLDSAPAEEEEHDA